jgi:threonine synthase
MNFFSINNPKNIVNFRTAVLRGIADDGGLYMPIHIPKLSPGFIETLPSLTLQEIALEVIYHFTDSISKNDLQNIIERAINFDAPLKVLSEKLSILELFHGPTLAFKDFGARFLTNVLAYFNKNEDKELIILVATSGDTGSAVANSFYEIGGIKVGLLYPSGMVSKIQEKQLTTMGKNIHAFEIEGTFDDCQCLVKMAFLDPDIKKKFNLSSANSINVARLLPQSFYYFYAYGQLKNILNQDQLIFTVPSGNFGNLTAGLIASRMGLPVNRFIAAVNANAVFPHYLRTGKYKPKAAIKTISNAMDVGNPSNFARVAALFNNDLDRIRRSIYSDSIKDHETMQTIQEIYKSFNYIIDPHGAVGCCALKKFNKSTQNSLHSIVLETAHPAKFADIVESALNMNVEIPNRLTECLIRQKKAFKISNQFKDFKIALLNTM